MHDLKGSLVHQNIYVLCIFESINTICYYYVLMFYAAAAIQHLHRYLLLRL